MGIKFRCEHCGKEVTAPDSAAGRRGKCPYCKQSNYIASPQAAEEDIPLAPIDEREEKELEEKSKSLLQQEKELLAESGKGEQTPLEHKEDLGPEDLHHFVVNYCLDMAASNLERAETHVEKLKKFGHTGVQAVDDFANEKVEEPALKKIPDKVLKGFLNRLREELKE